MLRFLVALSVAFLVVAGGVMLLALALRPPESQGTVHMMAPTMADGSAASDIAVDGHMDGHMLSALALSARKGSDRSLEQLARFYASDHAVKNETARSWSHEVMQLLLANLTLVEDDLIPIIQAACDKGSFADDDCRRFYIETTPGH
ncbi:MAG: hypothetical protein EP335_14040 [Alphaproteobacteria bacterium]|nr:MAG: hypothetical protein EP335_14040 [Alphaproteobacteria bacterium]